MLLLLAVFWWEPRLTVSLIALGACACVWELRWLWRLLGWAILTDLAVGTTEMLVFPEDAESRSALHLPNIHANGSAHPVTLAVLTLIWAVSVLHAAVLAALRRLRFGWTGISNRRARRVFAATCLFGLCVANPLWVTAVAGWLVGRPALSSGPLSMKLLVVVTTAVYLYPAYDLLVRRWDPASVFWMRDGEESHRAYSRTGRSTSP